MSKTEIPQQIPKSQMVPGVYLSGRHHPGSLHQRSGERGHHLHRAEVRLAVHPVRDDRLLLRHRILAGHDSRQFLRWETRSQQAALDLCWSDVDGSGQFCLDFASLRQPAVQTSPTGGRHSRVIILSFDDVSV